MQENEVSLIPPQLEGFKTTAHKDVLKPEQFLEDFANESRRLGVRELGGKMFVQTLVFEPDAVGQAVLEIFQEAGRKVQRTIYADWYSLLIHYGIPKMMHSFRPSLREDEKRKEFFYKSVGGSGIDLIFTNSPGNLFSKLVPLIGRNHMKAAYIESPKGAVFYMMGFNLDEENQGYCDFAVKFTGNVARKLAREFEAVRSGEVNFDYSVTLEYDEEGPKSMLLVDAGNPGQSMIYETASGLMDKAESSIQNISYIFPDSRLGGMIDRARERGVDTEIISHRPTLDSWNALTINNIWWLQCKINSLAKAMSRQRVPIVENPFRGTHAKLLIVDKKWALFGSHNLAHIGVRVGTVEWSILTRDSHLVGRLLARYADFKMECSTDPYLF